MVFYAPRRQPRKSTDGKITDLPDELLLCILDYLEPRDLLSLRLTCAALTPAGNTAVSQRTKRLYISPTRSSLLAAVELCGHRTFSSNIEEVVILGSTPQRHEWLSRRRLVRREYGDWFTTWPTTFPTIKTSVTGEDAGPPSDKFCHVYKPLLDALSTLPRLKRLSFANRVSRSQSGFNQTKQASLESFPKRHLDKPSAKYQRWSDGYAMFAILAALGPQIQEMVLPHLFADVYKDLTDATDHFALSVPEDASAPEESGDGSIGDNLHRARLGGYVVRNGRSLVGLGKFNVGKDSAIGEIRRRRYRSGDFWLDGTNSTSKPWPSPSQEVNPGLLAIAQSRAGWHNDKTINIASIRRLPKRVISTRTRPSIPEHLHGTITKCVRHGRKPARQPEGTFEKPKGDGGPCLDCVAEFQIRNREWPAGSRELW